MTDHPYDDDAVYHGSKGATLMRELPFTHLKNAIAKLERDAPHREREIADGNAHLRKRRIDYIGVLKDELAGASAERATEIRAEIDRLEAEST